MEMKSYATSYTLDCKQVDNARRCHYKPVERSYCKPVYIFSFQYIVELPLLGLSHRYFYSFFALSTWQFQISWQPLRDTLERFTLGIY